MNRYIKAVAIRLPVLRKVYMDKEALRRKLAKDKETLRRELTEVEGQRDGFLKERDEAEAKLKELYAYHQKLETDIARVYSGHAEMEREINYLKFQMETLDQLHEKVVERKWSREDTWSQYMCCFPFTRIDILPRGEVYTCCSGYLKSGYSIGNIYTDSIDDIWNSDKVKKLRYSVIKGDFEYCQEKCLFWKNRGQKLFPIKERQESGYEDYHQCMQESGPRYISLSCDETCNLMCKSCRKARHGLTKEESKKLETVLLQKIRPLLTNCIQLELLGSGEIFASTACISLLKSLTAEEFPNLRIGIVTNGQLLNRKRWEELANLKGIPMIFSVSVDAAEKKTYEELRLGGKWETLCDNMAFLRELRREGTVEKVSLNFVVQRDNFRQMQEFVALAESWNADQINFVGVDNWGTYSQEEYREINIFDPGNPHRQEAKRILKEILQMESKVKILHNIPGV